MVVIVTQTGNIICVSIIVNELLQKNSQLIMSVLLSFSLFSYKQTKQKYGTRNTACRLLDHRQQQLGITTGSYLLKEMDTGKKP